LEFSQLLAKPLLVLVTLYTYERSVALSGNLPLLRVSLFFGQLSHRTVYFYILFNVEDHQMV